VNNRILPLGPHPVWRFRSSGHLTTYLQEIQKLPKCVVSGCAWCYLSIRIIHSLHFPLFSAKTSYVLYDCRTATIRNRPWDVGTSGSIKIQVQEVVAQHCRLYEPSGVSVLKWLPSDDATVLITDAMGAIPSSGAQLKDRATTGNPCRCPPHEDQVGDVSAAEDLTPAP